jgi:hypothetical protein
VFGQYKADIIINSLNITCSRHDISENCSFVVKEEPLTHSSKKWTSSLTHRNVPCSRHDIAKNGSFAVKQQ